MDALKPEDPARVGPFIPLARIGAGGMGRVYLARSRGGRPVAVKVIRAEYAEDERFRTRFRREVQAARTVDGMYTAPVLDAGPDDDEPWLATAYIPGPSLQRAVHEHGPLPERSARILGAGIAEALGAIHGAGLIHRDLKPSNVILGPDGPRVIDFGISASEGGSSLTTTGIVVGSARYASPEQCRAEPSLGPASDVFALGGVLVYATTGVPPFGDGPDHVQLYLVVHETPDLTGVPMALRPILSACLEKDPANRPTTDQLLDILLPPDETAAAAAVDWLPEAVNRDLRKYTEAPMSLVAAAPMAAAAEGATHARFGDVLARTPAPANLTLTPAPVTSTPTGAGFDGADPTGIGSAIGTTASPPASGAGSDSPSNPGRRRLLAGIAGVVVVAAGGGGAWYAATRESGKKSATQSAGATFPPSTTSQSSPAPGGPTTPATPSTPAVSTTPTPTHTLGPWAEDWSSKTDLGGAAGGAVISGTKLLGIYTATSVVNPNPPQDLIAIDTVSGGPAFPAKSIPTVDNVGGAGIAADDTYVYSFGGATVYAWSLADGSAAWSAKSGLQTSTSTNNMPATGILGLVGGLLMVGSGNYDPSFPPCLAAFDVKTRKAVWSMKPSDMQVVASPPAGLDLTQTSVAVAVPTAGNLFYVTLSDQNSLRVLRAMDLQTGKEAWHVFFKAYSDNGAGTANPTVTGTEQHVYLTDMHSGSVHAYDTAGKWMWTYPSALDTAAPSTDRRFTGLVLESGDSVYAADANRVYALQVSSKQKAGTPLWKDPATFSGIANIPALVGDKIWVEVHTPTEKNPLAMTVLNTADGQVVHSYPMPEGPTASSADLTVPDPSGQAAYVLTASGEVLGYRRDQ